ncbi:MAG: hypothetical protein G01um1014106_694 [Parcubacteria group bacterium Gr01-1014_106]|nr:MAG: hypothetical protein G01um1014106_694 [Parcubacteria group bacterium Gr01-1014_106]
MWAFLFCVGPSLVKPGGAVIVSGGRVVDPRQSQVRSGRAQVTMYLTWRGRRNWKVLYEEVAHSLERIVGARYRRYDDSPEDHLLIFQGLQSSPAFRWLRWWDRKWVEVAVATLERNPGREGPGRLVRWFWRAVVFCSLWL